MSIILKTEAEIESMRKGGKILAEVLEKVCEMAKPGVSTGELDEFAENYIRERGGKPGFKGFHGFPATLCTAIDEIIVHGIPSKKQILKEGDLFTVDCGVILEGFYTDAARSIGIGEISQEKQRLLDTAYRALDAAIDIAKPGVSVSEIGKVIEKIVKEENFHIIKDLTGHGLGKELHEDPVILNYYDGKLGPKLKEGMTIAIEPIFASGTGDMKTLADQWTIVTSDNSPSVQVENSIVITKNGNEILTQA